MSGIVGIHNLRGGSVDRVSVERMARALAHRGPDAEGVWTGGSVGLGHRMLRTTPESLNETLPLIGAGGDLAITADARIDNRDQLIAAFGWHGRSGAEIGDAGLILKAYEKWGEHSPEHLLGDFAFAIWDRRKNVVFCARDHFGVKPFYYHLSGTRLVFASEIKALLSLDDVPRELNDERIGEYLVSIFDDTASTFYRDISRLPPSHSMTVGADGASLRSY